ncbi:MAG: hypothetical protein V2I33_24045, partial [Kangiellaceae bacterium]|nr:hypothetical protein [Kangiellaceae bacterium]
MTSAYVTATLTLAATLQTGEAASFVVTNIRNPGTTAPSNTFRLYTFTSAGDKIDKIESGVTVATDTPGTISEIVVSATSSLVATETEYVVLYTPVNVHPVGATVEITVPDGLTIGGAAACEAVVPYALDAGATCAAPIGRTFTITGGFTTSIQAPQQIGIKITALTNPPTQDEIGPWLLLAKSG